MADDGDSTPSKGQFVKANGLEIYYWEMGEGTPLLLLHGGTADSASWQSHAALFAEHFRVIMADTRGHGRTRNPSGELNSYAILADDVAAFVQAVGLDKPLIAGFSDGGQIALEIGLRHPDLARALVMGGTTYKFTNEYFAMLTEWGIEGSGVVNWPQVHIGMADAVDYWREAHAPLGGPDYWQTLLESISTLWWTPLHYSVEDFQKITTPTLVLLGDRDPGVPVAQAFEMYHMLPNAELAIVPGASHYIPEDLFATLISNFLLRQTNDREVPHADWENHNES